MEQPATDNLSNNKQRKSSAVAQTDVNKTSKDDGAVPT